MPDERTLTASEMEKVWKRLKLRIPLQRCADDLGVSIQRLDQALWTWCHRRTQKLGATQNPYTSPSEKYRAAAVD